jgi:hypothetical protein
VTLSNNYIFDYNIGNNIWNNIVWILVSGKSYIYINGTICQIDTVGTITNLTNRTYGFIARTNNTTGYAIENANIDDFRYYKDKALSYAEIYQLYNNSFYTLDICGGFLANGSSVIYEPSGSIATANSGSLTLLHGDAGGSSSIMFKSVNDPLEYGYIEYDENGSGSTGVNYGLMTIGIENDGGSSTAQADRISLFASGGTGFVGVNTKTPLYSLDVSGQMRIYEGVGTVASATNGSLTLEHANAGGASSLVFKGPNSTTSDYAYIEYDDNSTITYIQSLYKWNLSPGAENTYSTGTTVDTSVGSNTSVTLTAQAATFNSVAAPSPPSTFPSNTYCISFNQTNQTGTGSGSSITYLESGIISMSQTNITISFWIRPDITYNGFGFGTGTYYRYYIAHFSDSNSVGVIDMYIRGYDQKLFVLFNNNGTNYKTSNSAIQSNVWTHVAFTLSPNNGFIYINGVKDEFTAGTGYTSFTSLTAYKKILFGMKWGANTGDNYNKGFRGYMNFINVFNQALSNSDITYLYNNPSYGQTTEGGLMTIGIENDTVYNDRITLWPKNGTGFVGINTKMPQATLDVSGSLNIGGNITNNNNSTVVISGETGSVLKLQNTSGVYGNGEVGIDFFGIESWHRYGRIACNDIGRWNLDGTGGGTYVHSMSFYTSYHTSYNLEAMRITATDTNASNCCDVKIYGNVEAGRVMAYKDSNGYYGISTIYSHLTFTAGQSTTDAANNPHMKLSSIGNLTITGVTTSTSFNYISDYRVKENVVPLDEFFTVDCLNPVTYNLKSSGKQDIGFIAHEVQEFYPFLVSGEKGGKDTQSLNYNGFIGILTKEIQVLKKKVAEQSAKALAKAAEQEARIQALEKMVFDLINK